MTCVDSLIALMKQEMEQDTLYDGFGLEVILEKHGSFIAHLNSKEMQLVEQCLKNSGFGEWVLKFQAARNH